VYESGHIEFVRMESPKTVLVCIVFEVLRVCII
jgi:hypothetical protein